MSYLSKVWDLDGIDTNYIKHYTNQQMHHNKSKKSSVPK